jgi:hypothetical protein
MTSLESSRKKVDWEWRAERTVENSKQTSATRLSEVDKTGAKVPQKRGWKKS